MDPGYRYAHPGYIRVVPAKAGTHTPCRSFERRCSMTLAQQLRPVVMGPGSRFACPGRQRWIFDSSFKQPITFPRREMRPSFAVRFARLKHQRAQGMPGARCARSLACKIKEHTSIVTTVTPASPGIPRAMVLTVSFALSPVTGLYCHCRRQVTTCRLDASVGASGPHDFAVRLTCCSSKAPSASTASRPAFVTIAIRPSVGRDGAGYRFDFGQTRTELFLQTGLDRANQIESIRQMALRAHAKTLQISGSMRSLCSDWRDNR